MTDELPRAVLVRSARAELARFRKLVRWVSGIWFALGVLGCAIIAGAAFSDAAARSDELWLLFCVFMLVAVLPGGALLAWSWMSVDNHRLIRELTDPAMPPRLIELGYAQDSDAEYRRVAFVTLRSGTVYTFVVTPDIP